MKGDPCNCIDIQHEHPLGCDEPEPVTGSGICLTCRYFARLDPGSDAALAKGCRCPVIDNEHGRGYMGLSGIYVIKGACPLHGKAL